MKKKISNTFILTLSIIALIMIGVLIFAAVAGRNTSLSKNQALSDLDPVDESPVIDMDSSNPVDVYTEEPARELESMIFWSNKLYSLSQIDEHSVYSDEHHELYGVIEESVSRYEKPAEELTTNDDILVGCEVYHFINEIYNDALSVNVENEIWIYSPYVDVPDDQKVYSFNDEQELLDLVIKTMEEYGYSQVDNESYPLLRFDSLPEEFIEFGVFEKRLGESSQSCSIAQVWYCVRPYRLLVLNQEQMDNPVPINKLIYIDRLRSQISPEYAWVVSQAHFTGYLDNCSINAELYSSDDVSDGYGNFIQNIISVN